MSGRGRGKGKVQNGRGAAQEGKRSVVVQTSRSLNDRFTGYMKAAGQKRKANDAGKGNPSTSKKGRGGVKEDKKVRREGPLSKEDLDKELDEMQGLDHDQTIRQNLDDDLDSWKESSEEKASTK